VGKEKHPTHLSEMILMKNANKDRLRRRRLEKSDKREQGLSSLVSFI